MQVRIAAFILLLLASLCRHAQDRSVLVIRPKTKQQHVNNRPKESRSEKVQRDLFLRSFTVGFLQNELKEKDYRDMKSYMGFSASFGQTFLINTPPSDWNIGLDVAYISLNYMNYKLRFHEGGRIESSQWHQAEAGIQIGMALLLSPFDNFNMKLYARYAPTYSAINADRKWYSSYGDYIVAGIMANIWRIGVGGDFRYGTCKYKDFSNTGEFTNIGVSLYACYNF
jgi:hypothetical protein